MSSDDIRAERLKKLELLKQKGINPYPARTCKTHNLGDVLIHFETLEEQEEEITVAGRIMSLREHGGLVFFDLFDGTGRMQMYLKKDDVEEEAFDLFVQVADQSDFVEVTGVAFTTKRGQKSIAVKTWAMLAKSLMPVPDEYFGLKDEDARYRKRYLDFLLNDESRNIVEKRAKFWSAVRRFHEERGFLEVQTPVLETTTGGGDADPFGTHHNALDIDVYMRISAGELWQKRLMVANFPKTFEIGRVFRNEGMSAEHLQDYDQCEAYWAYADFKQMYTFLKECYQYVAQEAFGTMKFQMRGFEVDLEGDWPLVDYTEEIEKQTGVNIWKTSLEDMKKKLADLNIEFDGASGQERIIDILWKYCRKNIGGPAILVNEPKITSPLAKTTDENPDLVERFHILLGGSEVGQGYSELNDPIDQRERFERQQALRDAGDDEAQMADWEFVEALEYGMPPTAGHGFSERTFAFFMDKPARETQLFPLMRPKQV